MWSIKKLKNEATVVAKDINIALVIAGDISIETTQEELQFSKKSFFYFTSDFKITSTSPYYEGYIISINHEFLSNTKHLHDAYPKSKDYYQAYSILETDFIKPLLLSLYKEKAANTALILSYLTILLEKLNNYKNHKNGKNSTLFQNFIDLIQDNIENNYCTGTYANLLNVPLKELIEEVKVHTQQTPCTVITELVIEKAKKLLTETNDSSKMIAYQLGFQEPYYFIKYFKRNVGVTPTQYRKQH